MRFINKIALMAIVLVSLSGCASLVVRPTAVTLLEQDKIYTVPAGSIVNVEVDHKPVVLTTAEDMKLVSPEFLGKQAEEANAKLDKNVSDAKSQGTKNAAISAGVTALALGGAAFAKNAMSKKADEKVK